VVNAQAGVFDTGGSPSRLFAKNENDPNTCNANIIPVKNTLQEKAIETQCRMSQKDILVSTYSS
jgi:hypothetical protein